MKTLQLAAIISAVIIYIIVMLIILIPSHPPCNGNTLPNGTCVGIPVKPQNFTMHTASSHRGILPPIDLIFEGYSGQPLIYVHKGETKVIDIVANITKSNSTVYLSNFSVKPKCNIVYIPDQCVPQGMSVSLSNSMITSTQHLQLVIKVSQNMTAGKYIYGIFATSELPMTTSPDNLKYSKMLWNYFIWIED